MADLSGRKARPQRRFAAVSAACAVLAAACAAQVAPTSAPPTPGVIGLLGRDWAEAELVEQPPGDPLRTLEPNDHPGGLGHPGRYQGGQADVRDVLMGSSVNAAVGYLDTALGPMAAAWASLDGRHWALLADFPTADSSVAWSLAGGPTGMVAVGSEGAGPAAWRSDDGRTWERLPAAGGLAQRSAEMTTVVAAAAGYVAGGSNTSPAGAAATLWRSTDGHAWEKVALAEPDGARVEGLAVRDRTVVAVGTRGTRSEPAGAIAWLSADDGRTWRRAPDSEDLALGQMHAVTASTHGFVAVGTDLVGQRAIAWRSVDGLAWTASPEAESMRNYGLQIEMRDAAWIGDRYLAAGHLLFGTQYPSAVIWSSTDGVEWTRAPDVPILQQAKIWAVTGAGGRALAVGTFGSPDFSIPTIWYSPPDGAAGPPG
jgi:hypothetical protein